MKKVTLLLDSEVHRYILTHFGKRNLSSTINEVLAEELLGECPSGFGMFRGVLTPFEREHDDRF